MKHKCTELLLNIQMEKIIFDPLLIFSVCPLSCSWSQVCTHLRRDFGPVVFAALLQILMRLLLGSSTLQRPPQTFYGIEVWRLAMPIRELNLTFLFFQTCRVELSSMLVSSDHVTFSESFRCSLVNLILERGDLACVVCFLGDWGPSCLGIIKKSLPCSSGLPHLAHDQQYPTRRELVWSPTPRAIDGHFVFPPFPNNSTVRSKLLGYFLVAHSSF